VRTREASWLPADVCIVYDHVLRHLPQHWERYLAPRFQTQTNLTLVHGDAFFTNFLCPKQHNGGPTYVLDWQGPAFDIGGYDLANLCATFWTSEQRHEAQRERRILERYLVRLQTAGVAAYTWDDLVTDYQAGIMYWVLVPVQDGHDGAGKAYWWTAM
jgi:thiamine kinase-like enzyme